MPERTYIEYDNARITHGEGHLINVEMYDGRKFENVEARRLFPLTGLRRYITLLDSEGAEQAVIRDLDTLMKDSMRVVEEALSEYYLIPKILRINSAKEKYGLLKLEVETDSGCYAFDVKHLHSSIKLLYDGRVLIKDSSDNRYDIPDYRTLDKKSLRIISQYL